MRDLETRTQVQANAFERQGGREDVEEAVVDREVDVAADVAVGQIPETRGWNEVHWGCSWRGSQGINYDDACIGLVIRLRQLLLRR